MQAVLGIGTNLGDREENLAAAITGLEELPGTKLLAMSNIYETAPFDVISPQEDYLNCCVLLDTELEPETLLELCLALEDRLGRVRQEYHGARTIDIDLLLYQGFASNTGASLCNGAPFRYFPQLSGFGPGFWGGLPTGGKGRGAAV